MFPPGPARDRYLKDLATSDKRNDMLQISKGVMPESMKDKPAMPAMDQEEKETFDQAIELPEGWTIKPHGNALGLFREGRKTPVAKGKTHEDLASKIAGVNRPAKAPAPSATAEDAPKSKGHVAIVGKHEFYRGNDGKLYKASLGGKIEIGRASCRERV